MVHADDLRNLSEVPRRISEKSTLLKKYDMPITFLDYGHVAKCNDPREIEKILHVLRSGEEGLYPDLIKKTEEKLFKLKPNSKYLRQTTPVVRKSALDKTELKNINDDLNNFLFEMEASSKELSAVKGCQNSSNYVPIRAASAEQIDNEKTTTLKRIKSTDYASWDKYDPDTEILKMDLKDEKMRKEAEKLQKQEKIGFRNTDIMIQDEAIKRKSSKSVKFNEFRTKTEALYEANREKEKGNEYFKVGDYHDALRHYTKSISHYTNVNALNNRALVNMKLKKYDKAIDDCNLTLQLEPNNFKALLRKAQSHESLKEYQEALSIVEEAIEVNPNDETAQNLAEKLRNLTGVYDVGRKRLTIVEIDDDFNNNSVVDINKRVQLNDLMMNKDKKRPIKTILKTSKIKNGNNSSNYELMPIPGTSNMKPPYYKIVNRNDRNEVENFYRELFSRPRVYYLTPVDNDVDDCMEIHIKPSWQRSESMGSKADRIVIKRAVNIDGDTGISKAKHFDDNFHGKAKLFDEEVNIVDRVTKIVREKTKNVDKSKTGVEEMKIGCRNTKIVDKSKTGVMKTKFAESDTRIVDGKTKIVDKAKAIVEEANIVNKSKIGVEKTKIGCRDTKIVDGRPIIVDKSKTDVEETKFADSVTKFVNGKTKIVDKSNTIVEEAKIVDGKARPIAEEAKFADKDMKIIDGNTKIVDKSKTTVGNAKIVDGASKIGDNAKTVAEEAKIADREAEIIDEPKTIVEEAKFVDRNKDILDGKTKITDKNPKTVHKENILYKQVKTADEQTIIADKVIAVNNQLINLQITEEPPNKSMKTSNNSCGIINKKTNDNSDDSFALEIDENPKKPLRKHINIDNRLSMSFQTIKNDSGGGGEPSTTHEDRDLSPDEELHAPYTFLKVWNGISKDHTYRKHAEVLRRLNMDRIVEVVGCKMDNNMFSTILNCLYRHFCVADEIDKVYTALLNLIHLPRFTIIKMFMSKDDKICAKNLIKFLNQHGRDLPENVKKKYL